MVAYERTSWGYTWNFETLVDHVKEAGYKTKSEWRRGNQSSIQAAKKWGVLDAVMAECGLTDTRKKHVGKWDSADTIITELRRLKVKTLDDWRNKSPGSKNAASRSGWTKQIQDALGIKRQHGTWESIEQVIEIVRSGGFKTKVEWIEKHNRSYATARLKGWLPEIFELFGLENQYKTWESVDDMVAHVKSLNARSRAYWCSKSPGSYSSAEKHGWTQEVCERVGIPEVASSFIPDRPHRIYILLIQTESGGAIGYGSTCNLKKRMSTHRTSAKKVNARVTLIASYKFPDWYVANQVEERLIADFEPAHIDVISFEKESTALSNLPTVREFVEFAHQVALP